MVWFHLHLCFLTDLEINTCMKYGRQGKVTSSDILSYKNCSSRMGVSEIELIT